MIRGIGPTAVFWALFLCSCATTEDFKSDANEDKTRYGLGAIDDVGVAFYGSQPYVKVRTTEKNWTLQSVSPIIENISPETKTNITSIESMQAKAQNSGLLAAGGTMVFMVASGPLLPVVGATMFVSGFGANYYYRSSAEKELQVVQEVYNRAILRSEP